MRVKFNNCKNQDCDWLADEKVYEMNVYSIYFFNQKFHYLVRSYPESVRGVLVDSQCFDIVDASFSKYWLFHINKLTGHFLISFKEWIKHENDHLLYFADTTDYDDNYDMIADLDWFPK
jgi:hypothetical protein